jgi:hypothetical protein
MTEPPSNAYPEPPDRRIDALELNGETGGDANALISETKWVYPIYWPTPDV